MRVRFCGLAIPAIPNQLNRLPPPASRLLLLPPPASRLPPPPARHRRRRPPPAAHRPPRTARRRPQPVRPSQSRKMAKSATEKSDTSNQPAALAAPRRARHWGVFFACLFAGVLLTVALCDYDPAQVNSTAPAPRNLVGRAGVTVSELSYLHLGLCTWLLPAFLFWMSWVSVRNARLLAATRFAAMLVCITAGCGVAAMVSYRPSGHGDYFPAGLGGSLGGLVYDRLLYDALGVFGAGMLLVALYSVAFAFIFTKDIVVEFEKITGALAAWYERRRIAAAERAELKRLAKAAAAAERAAKKAAEAAARQSLVIIKPVKSARPASPDDPAGPDAANTPPPDGAGVPDGTPPDAGPDAGKSPAAAKVTRAPAPGAPAI
ncbi:MAG: DNA translocase FtsK 4TM domain-containing protein, partial [Opitutaceae bacterium]|nr:DNA translocase FtsK 4TM domain-containing protein [Opitutaceae bacterium]